jgi:hypothetical protein
MKGGLDNGVLLGVNAATQLMALSGSDIELLSQTPDIDAMTDATRSPIVPGTQHPFISHDNGPHGPTAAGGALGDQRGDLHKVSFPSRSREFHRHSFISFFIP